MLNTTHPFETAVKTFNIQTDHQTPESYFYYDLDAVSQQFGNISRLPFSLKILFENLVRHADKAINKAEYHEHLAALVDWQKNQTSDHEIPFLPARVLMQDFTGVPAICDLATMRDAISQLGGKAEQINPLYPVDLVIDHSVMVDYFGSRNALTENMDLEFHRNGERYRFLKWGQESFQNLRVVPPGMGICHQVNIEYLASVIANRLLGNRNFVFPDSLVGTDSHTTMVNGLGVIGFGVGGIEASAAMLGQPVPMIIPDVIGFKLTGFLKPGVTATDLVLTCVEMLRKKGVVGKFVEFFGSGLASLSVADRATISNMAPEYGATVGLFPIDAATLSYLKLTGRPMALVKRVEAYAKAAGLFYDPTSSHMGEDAYYTDRLELDLSTVVPSLAGPKRPQDRVALTDVAKTSLLITKESKENGITREKTNLKNHAIVIAAITSCTNTSNPYLMLAAGLLAKKARKLNLTTKPWVKTSLTPGSRVAMDYLTKSHTLEELEALGFAIAGFGCATCIGNSGPLPMEIEQQIIEKNLTVAAVLSGNRNFEARIHQAVKANWLASPPLVVAYALLGSTSLDITKAEFGKKPNGDAILLPDLWPTAEEINKAVEQSLTSDDYSKRYAKVFLGTPEWEKIPISKSETYPWQDNSTYIKPLPFFDNMPIKPKPLEDLTNAKLLALFGDSITTDHISPAGSINEHSPAGQYLIAHGVKKSDFNSYGARRGNFEVMVRGTFANSRIKNLLIESTGGLALYQGKAIAIFDAAMQYKKLNLPLIVIAGKEYGTGSSRDWAAKGTMLLGVKVVIAESFERIHRSNLVGMGVLPLEFQGGKNANDLHLTGEENFTIKGIKNLTPKCQLTLTITYQNGKILEIPLLTRVDNQTELQYYQHGGILPYMLRQLASIKV